MPTDINGLRKAVTKQLDLTLAQYDGTAREGDLVIDTNPGPTLNQLFVGTANGALTPVNTGGGNAESANYANYAGNVTISNQPNITSVGTLTSLTVAGDILPDANVTHDLGSPTQRWNSIYLSNNTIYLGDSELSVNGTGNLTVDGVQVAYLSNSGNIQVNAVETQDLLVTGSAWILGNLTVSGTTTYIDVTTLQVEDPVIQLGRGPNGTPLTSNDGKDRGVQLHVYNTGVSAEVDKFMGWKNADDEFVFASNVTNLNDVIAVNTLGNVRAATFIGDLDGTASSADQAYAVDAANVSGSVANAVYADNAGVAYSVGAANVVGPVANAVYADSAGTAGVAYSIDAANVVGSVANAVYADDAGSVDLANVVGAGNITSINLDGNVSNVLAGDGTWIAAGGGGASLPLANGTTNFDIATVNGNATVTANGFIWTFDESVGTLEIPGNLKSGNSYIQSVPNNAGDSSGLSTLNLVPDNATGDDRYIIIDPTGPNHVHIRAGGPQDGSSTLLYLGGEQAYVMVADATHEVSIAASDVGNSIGYQWTFKNDGNLLLPGNINVNNNHITNATSVQSNAVFTTTNTTASAILDLSTGDLFVRTITGSTTFSLSNVPAAGKNASFVLQLTNPGTSVTFWSGIKWNNGTPPTLTTTGTDVLGFYTYDGGTTWVGLVLAQNIS